MKRAPPRGELRVEPAGVGRGSLALASPVRVEGLQITIGSCARGALRGGDPGLCLALPKETGVGRAAELESVRKKGREECLGSRGLVPGSTWCVSRQPSMILLSYFNLDGRPHIAVQCSPQRRRSPRSPPSDSYGVWSAGPAASAALPNHQVPARQRLGRLRGGAL